MTSFLSTQYLKYVVLSGITARRKSMPGSGGIVAQLTEDHDCWNNTVLGYTRDKVLLVWLAYKCSVASIISFRHGFDNYSFLEADVCSVISQVQKEFRFSLLSCGNSKSHIMLPLAEILTSDYSVKITT